MVDGVLRAVSSILAPAGPRSRLSTLIFHRVLAAPDSIVDEPTAEQFEQLLTWIRRQFQVISLADAVDGLRHDTLPYRPLVITFDDGYADNHRIAAPILKRLGLPATFFIASGYLDGGRMFNDAVIIAMRDCRSSEVDLLELGLGCHLLNSIEDRRHACSVLLPKIKVLAIDQRDTVAERICELANVSPPNDLMMSSAQVAALHRDGFEIGAHTVTHPILAKLDPIVAKKEIADGRRQLEEIIGGRVRFFAYPNGRPHEDYNLQTVALVRELGFDAALTTARGVANRGVDLFQLPRFTPWDRSRFRFGLRMARNMLSTNLGAAPSAVTSA